MLALHICINPCLETVTLNVVIPLGALRRNMCQEMHYGGEYFTMQDLILLRTCCRPVLMHQDLNAITLTNPRVRIRVADLRTETLTVRRPAAHCQLH